MKVIITMAGDGTRFTDAGIGPQKYRLQLRDRTMFEWAMESLRAFFDHPFIFVTRADHDARGFVDDRCDELGIDRRRIVELEDRTSGQATTALAADDYVRWSEPIAIYNIDTYVEPGVLAPDSLAGDGCIPVFEASDNGWSYCEVDDDGHVQQVAEKEAISEWATLGLYYFGQWQLFRRAFRSASRDVETEYGERYIAPLYNWLIEHGQTVTADHVPREQVHVLGTPEEASAFDSDFPERYGLTADVWAGRPEWIDIATSHNHANDSHTDTCGTNNDGRNDS